MLGKTLYIFHNRMTLSHSFTQTEPPTSTP